MVQLIGRPKVLRNIFNVLNFVLIIVCYCREYCVGYTSLSGNTHYRLNTFGIHSQNRPNGPNANRRACVSGRKRELFLSSSDSVSQSEDIDFESLMEMDIVLFSRASDKITDDSESNSSTSLEIGAIQEDGSLASLCVWTNESMFGDVDDSENGGSMEFLVDEEAEAVDTNDGVSIKSLLPETVFSYGSRQVGGGMGPGNPHGELSEMLYYIDKQFIVENAVKFEVRPDLEIFW